MNIKNWALKTFTKQDVVFNEDKVASVLSRADEINNDEIRFEKLSNYEKKIKADEMASLLIIAKWQIMDLVKIIQNLTEMKENKDKAIDQEMDKIKDDRI